MAPKQPPPKRQQRPLSAGAAADRIIALRTGANRMATEAHERLTERLRRAVDTRAAAILARCSDAATASRMVEAAAESEDE